MYDVTGDKNQECKDASTFKEDAPGIALATFNAWNAQNCYTGGAYNHKDFSIQPLQIYSTRAYKITGPQTKATDYAHATNTIWLSFANPGSYKIYVIDIFGAFGSVLKEAGTVTATEKNTFVKTPVLADAGADESKTVVIAEASKTIAITRKP